MILEQNAKEVLLSLPLYAPALLAVHDPDLTALVLRVDTLKCFARKDLLIQASFNGYEHGGTHLACVAFRVFDNEQDPLLGDAYLNPRQAIERRALENLARQEEVPFVFLSENAAFARAVSLEPGRDSWRVDEARCRIRGGEPGRALGILTPVVTRDPPPMIRTTMSSNTAIAVAAYATVRHGMAGDSGAVSG